MNFLTRTDFIFNVDSHFRQWHPTPVLFLENPMDRGACWAAVHGVAKSQTWLSDFTFTFHFHALEKEMATPSSVLAWRIPGTGEPGGLLSMGLPRHDWSDLAKKALNRPRPVISMIRLLDFGKSSSWSFFNSKLASLATLVYQKRPKNCAWSIW